MCLIGERIILLRTTKSTRCSISEVVTLKTVKTYRYEEKNKNIKYMRFNWFCYKITFHTIK